MGKWLERLGMASQMHNNSGNHVSRIIVHLACHRLGYGADGHGSRGIKPR